MKIGMELSAQITVKNKTILVVTISATELMVKRFVIQIGMVQIVARIANKRMILLAIITVIPPMVPKSVIQNGTEITAQHFAN